MKYTITKTCSMTKTTFIIPKSRAIHLNACLQTYFQTVPPPIFLKIDQTVRKFRELHLKHAF